MNLPAEFVIHRKISGYSQPKGLDSLGCPRNILEDVCGVCDFWARCFRDYRGLEPITDGVSVERFLIAADFSIIQMHHSRERPRVANDRELWYWILRVAQIITPARYFDSLRERLQSPDFCVLVPTWTNTAFRGES